MTIWIIPEFDREGRAVCQFWHQGGIHSETPTDKKNEKNESPPLRPLSFLKGRNEGANKVPRN